MLTEQEDLHIQGSISPLPADDKNEHIGNVLRTQTGINPIFVSAGHKFALATATDIILKVSTEFRSPEITRRADQYAREALLL